MKPLRARKSYFFFFLFLLLALFLAGGIASLLPHQHDKDWNHSRHSDCPFYRLASQTLISLILFTFPLFLVFSERLPFCLFFEFPQVSSGKPFLTRAPPIFSFLFLL